MTNHLSIGAGARFLGVCVNTLRSWDRTGALSPAFRTDGGHRRYAVSDVDKLAGRSGRAIERKSIAYARVSTQDRKHDLGTQVDRLKLECSGRGWADTGVIADLGSGMNYKKRGLCKLIAMLCRREVGRLIILRQDRLLRFRVELL